MFSNPLSFRWKKSLVVPSRNIQKGYFAKGEVTPSLLGNVPLEEVDTKGGTGTDESVSEQEDLYMPGRRRLGYTALHKLQLRQDYDKHSLCRTIPVV